MGFNAAIHPWMCRHKMHREIHRVMYLPAGSLQEVSDYWNQRAQNAEWMEHWEVLHPMPEPDDGAFYTLAPQAAEPTFY